MGFVFPLSSSNFEPNTIRLYFLKFRSVCGLVGFDLMFFDCNTIAIYYRLILLNILEDFVAMLGLVLF